MKILENEVAMYPRVGDKYCGETITSVRYCLHQQSLCREKLGIWCAGRCTLRNREFSYCIWILGDKLKYEIKEGRHEDT